MKIKNKYTYSFIIWFAILFPSFNFLGWGWGLYVYCEYGFLDAEVIFRSFITSIVLPFIIVFIEISLDFIPFIYSKMFK
ncbi:hypothetical protein ACWIW6_10120 [Ursidibacter sp. B-7004-1]